MYLGPRPAGPSYLGRPPHEVTGRTYGPAGSEECRVHVDRALQLGIGSVVWSMLVRPIICSLLDVRSIPIWGRNGGATWERIQCVDLGGKDTL